MWALIIMLLLCPIMMLFMHREHHHSRKHHNQEGHNHSSEMERLDSYKIRELEGEIEFLKKQNERLQTEVEKITYNNIQK